MRSRFLVVLAATGMLAAGCDRSSYTPASSREVEVALTTQFVSYDVTAGHDQRVIVGLQTKNGLVSYGRVRLSFEFLGTKTKFQPEQSGPTIDAVWTPVPGQKLAARVPSEPRVVRPADGVGVYAGTVRFDRTGSWRVTAITALEGRRARGGAVFDVNDKPTAVDIGDPAPRTENLVLGAAPPAAVDSRATNGPIPDPELHRQTIAQSIANGRPTMIVISTPVYCVSRFCGPITDSVEALDRTYGKRMNFVHLEVWHNFQNQEVNRAAAEWIYKTRTGDLHEPWVYVIDADGKVVQRFDNVASDAELAAAVRAVVSG